MHQLVCRPEVGANLLQMYAVSGVFAIVVTASIVHWRVRIKQAIKRGVEHSKRHFPA